jgi:hypothetical protein
MLLLLLLLFCPNPRRSHLLIVSGERSNVVAIQVAKYKQESSQQRASSPTAKKCVDNGGNGTQEQKRRSSSLSRQLSFRGIMVFEDVNQFTLSSIVALSGRADAKQ